MSTNPAPLEPSSAEVLRAEIERLGPWHHDVEVAPGVSTMGVRGATDPDHRFNEHYSPERMMEHLLGPIYPEGLQGRSFLDCACNSGGHSIAAARRGAGRSFAFDARQHWVDQAQFLARHCGAPELEVRRCELNELPGLGLEPFDVTLFAGIFYHLPDPMSGLRIAADLTRELLILNTAVRPRRDRALVLNVESDTHVLSGVDRLAWLPTGPAVMKEILAWCGFKHSRIDLYWSNGVKGWKRLQMVAARDEKALAAYDKARPDAMRPPTLKRRALIRLYQLFNRG
jgi:SAM-dependent methyltransferase